MRTFSHFLITALVNDGLKLRRIPVYPKSLLLGSIMPDVPLLALTLGFVVRRTVSGVPAAADPICGSRYNNLYFHNPIWIAGHNLLHAPLIIGLLGLIGYRFGLRQKKKWGISLYWFTVACGIHALIDIVTHHSDGPLLFFPLNWSVRFRAPVSYWDIQHSGKVMALFEQLLNSAILIYLAITRLVNNTLNKWMAQ